MDLNTEVVLYMRKLIFLPSLQNYYCVFLCLNKLCFWE